jgi:hypothetical protein
MIIRQTFSTLGILLLAFPATLFARTNILTTGLSTSVDYDSPEYESVAVDSLQDGSVGVKINDARGDDSANLVVRPLVRFVSESLDNTFELRAAPGVKYDILNEENGWDADLSISAGQSMSKNWRLMASDAFIRSDNYNPQYSGTLNSPAQDSQSTTPALAADRGRSLYWQNTAKLASEHTYAEESLVQFSIDYNVLRNDETDVLSYDDYDRSTLNVMHKHRFNPVWKTGADFSLVRGDFTTTGQQPVSENQENKDLWEYHFLANVDNTDFLHHKISLNYTYIGTRYDEDRLGDSQIHEMQLIWWHEFSPQLNTTLGAGPSYEKSTGQEANVGGNGKAEINYLIEKGRISFGVEKGYDVDNFSGTGERGFVDFWNTHLQFAYQLSENFSLNSRLNYRYEDRQEPSTTISGEINDLTEYNTEVITAGLGLRYAFMRYYSAGLNYTYTDEDSERIGDDYYDHRLLLTLSWEQEWLRW